MYHDAVRLRYDNQLSYDQLVGGKWLSTMCVMHNAIYQAR